MLRDISLRLLPAAAAARAGRLPGAGRRYRRGVAARRSGNGRGRARRWPSSTTGWPNSAPRPSPSTCCSPRADRLDPARRCGRSRASLARTPSVAGRSPRSASPMRRGGMPVRRRPASPSAATIRRRRCRGCSGAVLPLPRAARRGAGARQRHPQRRATGSPTCAGCRCCGATAQQFFPTLSVEALRLALGRVDARGAGRNRGAAASSKPCGSARSPCRRRRPATSGCTTGRPTRSSTSRPRTCSATTTRPARR